MTGRRRPGPQRRGQPRRGHLARDDAPQVVLERHDVDQHQRRARPDHPQRAVPVVVRPADADTAVDPERLRAAQPHRACEVLHNARVGGGVDDAQAARRAPLDAVGAGRKLLRRAPALVDDRDPGCARDRVGRPAARKLDAHLHRVRERGQGRSLVVVGQDRVVGPPVRGVAVGAALGHADAVAPSVAGQRVGCAGLRRRHGGHDRRRDAGKNQGETSGHRRSHRHQRYLRCRRITPSEYRVYRPATYRRRPRRR